MLKSLNLILDHGDLILKKSRKHGDKTWLGDPILDHKIWYLQIRLDGIEGFYLMAQDRI